MRNELLRVRCDMNYQFLEPKMTDAALNLGKTLTSAKEYVGYQRAKQVFYEDVSARNLMAELAKAEVGVRRAAADGTITPEDLQTLSDLQTQVQANPVITEFTTRKQELTTFLQGINNEISQLLGINFALVAKHSSCC